MDRELGGWVHGCRKGEMGCGRMDGWKGMDRWVGGEMHERASAVRCSL